MIYAKSVCPLKMNINCAISCCCPLQLPSTFCVRQINLKAATISEITNCERVVVGGVAFDRSQEYEVDKLISDNIIVYAFGRLGNHRYGHRR